MEVSKQLPHPIVYQVRTSVKKAYEVDQHGDRALYLAGWLQKQSSATATHSEFKKIGKAILGDIAYAVSQLLHNSETESPVSGILEQLHEIGQYRIMGWNLQVGPYLVKEAMTEYLCERPFASQYALILLTPGESLADKVQDLSNWFYDRDKNTSNALYRVSAALPDEETENRHPKWGIQAKWASAGQLRIKALLEITNRSVGKSRTE